MKHELLTIEVLDRYGTPGAQVCNVCMGCTCCGSEKLNEECPGEWNGEEQE